MEIKTDESVRITDARVTNTPVETIKSTIPAEELEVMTRGLTLADAVRLGSQYTNKAEGWGMGDNACFLSSAYIAAKASGYVDGNK